MAVMFFLPHMYSPPACPFWFVGQLENPASTRLAEIGCANTLTNHWRAMRHRLRRRLERQRIAAFRNVRAARMARAAITKGVMRPSGGSQSAHGSLRASQAIVPPVKAIEVATATELSRTATVDMQQLATNQESDSRKKRDHREEASASDAVKVSSVLGKTLHMEIDGVGGVDGEEPHSKRARSHGWVEDERNRDVSSV